MKYAPYGECINDELVQRVITQARLALIDPRHPVGLSRVVPPLPVQINCREDPCSKCDAGKDNRRKDNKWKPRYEEFMLFQAGFIEGQSRERRDYMVVTQQPGIQNEKRPEERGREDNDPPAGNSQRCSPENERGVKRGAAQPSRLMSV